VDDQLKVRQLIAHLGKGADVTDNLSVRRIDASSVQPNPRDAVGREAADDMLSEEPSVTGDEDGHVRRPARERT
jgi:hypothetical protein